MFNGFNVYNIRTCFRFECFENKSLNFLFTSKREDFDFDMARVESFGKYQLLHRVKCRSLIRGHHVYKANWTPVLNEKLIAKPDIRDEALENDKFAIGIFKEKDGETELVGHAPIELSSLLHHFLNADPNNFINVTVMSKRKREIGLVVPGKFDCFTKSKRISCVLDEQLHQRKDTYKTLELIHQKKSLYRKFPVIS